MIPAVPPPIHELHSELEFINETQWKSGPSYAEVKHV